MKSSMARGFKTKPANSTPELVRMPAAAQLFYAAASANAGAEISAANGD
jgi:hypothetical protein